MREECLGMALELGAEFGVWGGTTPEERRRMARATAGRRTRELFEAPLSRPA
ncbi:WhiB family transcriptional regulator [Pimelobacter simplex]|uniref:WhiB family transcriptional regulator n=1 Tax=Nocardioides simplex TaxID=2045 RepID=UPI004040A500